MKKPISTLLRLIASEERKLFLVNSLDNMGKAIVMY